MKISYVNDLHLDFYVDYTTNPKKLEQRVQDFAETMIKNSTDADILIIAGDFGHVNAVSQLFLEHISPHYDKIFATYGNHDMYLISNNDKKKFGKNSHRRVSDLIERTAHVKNLTWLTDNTVHEYGGLTIAGHPMFALPEHPAELLFYRQSMNDYRYIFHPHGYGLPEFHQDGVDSYAAMPDVDLFVSHFPLVKTPEFRNDASQGSYYNMVEELKAKHYFFGHVHQRDNFTVMDTEFHTHAVGYPGEGFAPGFGLLKL